MHNMFPARKRAHMTIKLFYLFIHNSLFLFFYIYSAVAYYVIMSKGDIWCSKRGRLSFMEHKATFTLNTIYEFSSNVENKLKVVNIRLFSNILSVLCHDFKIN